MTTLISFLFFASVANAAAPNRNDEELWHNQCEKGDQAEIEKNYGKAENFFKASLQTATSFGPDSKQMQTSVARMGTILVLQGHFDEANPYFFKSITLVQNARKKGEPDPDALVWLDDFADSYQEMGKKIKTRRMTCLEHCVALRQAIAPGRHSKLAAACNELASIYIPAGRYEDAEKIIGMEIQCIQNKYGPKATIFMAQATLAMTQEKQKKYDAAVENQTRAVATMEQGHLAGVYIEQGKKDLARMQAESRKAKSDK